MKILVVDDERTFNFPDETVTYARTSEDAINCIYQFKWDVIFLDHDLGGDDTTIPVAKFLREYEDPTPVYIHSMNPIGRKNLLFDLPHAQIIDLEALL